MTDHHRVDIRQLRRSWHETLLFGLIADAVWADKAGQSISKFIQVVAAQKHDAEAVGWQGQLVVGVLQKACDAGRTVAREASPLFVQLFALIGGEEYFDRRSLAKRGFRRECLYFDMK
ncbi:hypothetical protein C2U71_12060 [Burkholderia ubonensis]|nr:hypothetical protein C2U71_12060 [Burkholderia ubonensis]